MRLNLPSLLCFALSSLVAACSHTPAGPPLETVPKLEVPRYMGTWFELARLPHPFQKNCQATQAIYALRDDGQVDVTNSCHKGAVDGPLSSVHGLARHVDGAPPGQLEVSFFRPFWSHYYILALAPDYSFAVVGHPNRKYAWILCRTRHMAPQTLAPLVELLEKSGFDTNQLIYTAQPDAN